MASKGSVWLGILLVTIVSHGWVCLGGGVRLSESKGLSRNTVLLYEHTVGTEQTFGTKESMMNEQSIAAAPATGHHLHRRHRHRKTGSPKHPSPGLVVAPALSPHHGHVHVPAPAPLSGGRPARSPFPPPAFIPLPAPSTDCHQKCSEPYTLTPAGDFCGCVLPMLISLQLGVAPYVFFPLVSELAQELAVGTNLSQSQVRILGANTVENNMDETEVKAELVPLGGFFGNKTAGIIAEKFWKHEVGISESLFGTYTVLSVQYPGLPPSPPSPGGDFHGPAGGPFEQPLSVNVKKKGIKPGVGIIAVVVLTASLSVICLVAVWLAWHCRNAKSPMEVDHMLSAPSANKKSGPSMLSSSLASSTTISFASSFTPYAGSAKTFTYTEIERATNNFKLQNVIGEGGFGRVYDGVLDDNTRVAVKVLTRDDHQGSREFVGEVEMLSRLHHRNLVKLLGICIEEHFRCLVFELISNGSVESHLHGIDKETSPLDWEARLKIALGAARGLAYLHEDSNPRVIHRDFKASNILLEADFTPKVSDFGLAKAATDEVNNHLSTRVMGTFGYVAPEYAMTGHLLVKSDVYSYGVVLLELLSGRKPVDMTQPPGQENLVTWARPLLNNKAGLEILVDPSLTNVTFDSLEKVAAIASMCVHPEVSHRPLMGEVVQALKLVYNDSDASDGLVSGNGSLRGETRREKVPRQSSVRPIHGHESDSFISIDYDSGEAGRQGVVDGKTLSISESFVGEAGAEHQCSSAPPITSKRPKRTWYRVRNKDNGTVSESALLRYKQAEANRNCYSGDTWLL